VIGRERNGLDSIPFGQYLSGIHIQENYSVKEMGKSAHLEVITTYTATRPTTCAKSRQGSSMEEVNKRYLNFYATDFPTIAADGSAAFHDDEESNKIVTTETYTIGSFWKYDSAITNIRRNLRPFPIRLPKDSGNQASEHSFFPRLSH